MASVLNISAYLFTAIDDPASLRSELQERVDARSLRGTILVAEEGINLFLAGPAEDVRGFVDELRAEERFAALTTKESWSAEQPFRKMLVKHKREIIRMDRPAIRPAAGRAPAVDPLTLRRWLETGRDDDGREVVLLDTRNAFEVVNGGPPVHMIEHFDPMLDRRKLHGAVGRAEGRDQSCHWNLCSCAGELGKKNRGARNSIAEVRTAHQETG